MSAGRLKTGWNRRNAQLLSINSNQIQSKFVIRFERVTAALGLSIEESQSNPFDKLRWLKHVMQMRGRGLWWISSIAWIIVIAASAAADAHVSALHSFVNKFNWIWFIRCVCVCLCVCVCDEARNAGNSWATHTNQTIAAHSCKRLTVPPSSPPPPLVPPAPPASLPTLHLLCFLYPSLSAVCLSVFLFYGPFLAFVSDWLEPIVSQPRAISFAWEAISVVVIWLDQTEIESIGQIGGWIWMSQGLFDNWVSVTPWFIPFLLLFFFFFLCRFLALFVVVCLLLLTFRLEQCRRSGGRERIVENPRKESGRVPHSNWEVEEEEAER